MKLKSVLLIICLMMLAWVDVCAWEQEVEMVVNELKIFPVHSLHRVAVSDPAIADLSVLSDRELMVIAKKPGAANLIIWDESGQRSFNIIVFAEDLHKIAQRIRGLLISSDIHGIRVKTEGDKICVIGELLTQLEIDKLKNVLAPFPNAVNLVNLKERQPLVEIDVNVLEVAIDDLKKLGLDWSTSLPISYTEDTEGDLPKLWDVFRWSRGNVIGKLNFLIEEDKARTLANPKLVTLSGKEASFLVGGEVPYITVETEGRTKVEWKDYGVNLKINPLVNSKNEIKAQIEAEVTDLDWGNAVTHSGYSIPAFKKRQVQTELFLNEEDTIFLAGLIKNEDSRDVERLPWLSKVPILGELFKSTQFRDKRTELVISITPRIIGEKATPEYLTSEMIKQETILAAQRRFPAYSEESSPLAYYTDMVEDIIARNVTYPDQAQEAREEGIVKIDLRLLPNGQLKKAAIAESSGSRALDEAALKAVQKLAPYPSFPSQITQKELRLTVPIVFKSYVKNE